MCEAWFSKYGRFSNDLLSLLRFGRHFEINEVYKNKYKQNVLIQLRTKLQCPKISTAIFEFSEATALPPRPPLSPLGRCALTTGT